MATLDDLLSVLQGASNSAASTVSAPVDGINWILKKAGFPVSDKPVGGSDWLKDKGLMADPKNQNLGYVGEAIGGVAPMLVGAYAPQIASKLNQMGSNLSAPRTLNPQTGAIVWHGSPHKFDKFDASKIGTGEGAQAYGHGLYLAESPGVATTYSNLRASPDMEFHTASGRKLNGLEKAIADDMLSNGVVSARIGAKANGPEWEEAFNRIKDENITRGSLYKVDLPDETIAKMLDWDKPLSQQGEAAQYVGRMVQKRIGPKAAQDPTGYQLYEALTPMKGGQAEAAQFLRESGIPGIRYLDGGSRGTGAGTSNFVVFPGNENLLRILERNGIPLD